MARPISTPRPPATIRRRPTDADLVARLHARGVAQRAAEELVADHSARRVVDALDALEEIDRGRVRSPAGWLVSAIRDNWDLTEILAQRRQNEARLSRWEREQLESDDADLVAERRQARSRAWYAAISGALDDTQLETAIERVTTPVSGLGRRSVPLARAQLVAWAVDVRRRECDAPFDKALRADLEAEPHPLLTIGGTLPPSPCAAPDALDLGERIDAVLLRRPDLERPDEPERALAIPRREARFGLDLER
jgi:hypothetical protein